MGHKVPPDLEVTMGLLEILDNKDNLVSLALEEPLVVWVVLEQQDN